jgi:hypothetical protein
VPPQGEIDAYCERLNGLLAAGGRLRTIQVYTIARGPAESFVTPLSDVELDQIAGFVRSRVAVPVDVHYGVVPNETPREPMS